MLSTGWLEFGTFMAGLEMVTLMAFGNTAPEKVGPAAVYAMIIMMIMIITMIIIIIIL